MSEADAPALLDIEVTQALCGLLRGGRLTPERASRACVDLAELSVRRHPDVALLGRAWALCDVCTTHDALYVALAEALGRPLLTRDARLSRGLDAASDVRCAVRLTA